MDDFVYKKLKDIYQVIVSSNKDRPITSNDLFKMKVQLELLLEMYKPVEEPPRKSIWDMFK